MKLFATLRQFLALTVAASLAVAAGAAPVDDPPNPETTVSIADLPAPIVEAIREDYPETRTVRARSHTMQASEEGWFSDARAGDTLYDVILRQENEYTQVTFAIQAEVIEEQTLPRTVSPETRGVRVVRTEPAGTSRYEGQEIEIARLPEPVVNTIREKHTEAALASAHVRTVREGEQVDADAGQTIYEVDLIENGEHTLAVYSPEGDELDESSVEIPLFVDFGPDGRPLGNPDDPQYRERMERLVEQEQQHMEHEAERAEHMVEQAPRNR